MIYCFSIPESRSPKQALWEDVHEIGFWASNLAKRSLEHHKKSIPAVKNRNGLGFGVPVPPVQEGKPQR